MARGEVSDGDYTTLKIPRVLADRIDTYVGRNRDGYRSRAEVVTAAIRAFLKEHEPVHPNATRTPEKP